MAAPTKTCPECGTVNFNMIKVCKGDGCGHVFFKKKKPRRKAEEVIDPAADAPGFSAGMTLDGGMVVFWYGRGDYQKFTPEETHLIRQALAPKSARDWSGDVPVYLPGPAALPAKTE